MKCKICDLCINNDRNKVSITNLKTKSTGYSYRSVLESIFANPSMRLNGVWNTTNDNDNIVCKTCENLIEYYDKFYYEAKICFDLILRQLQRTLNISKHENLSEHDQFARLTQYDNDKEMLNSFKKQLHIFYCKKCDYKTIYSDTLVGHYKYHTLPEIIKTNIENDHADDIMLKLESESENESKSYSDVLQQRPHIEMPELLQNLSDAEDGGTIPDHSTSGVTIKQYIRLRRSEEKNDSIAVIDHMHAHENILTTPIFVDVSLASELNDDVKLPSPSEPDDDLPSPSQLNDDARSRIECLYCNVILNNRAQMETHCGDAHFYCLKCNEKFATRIDLRRHRTTTKHTGFYKCSRCTTKFESKILRDQHLCQNSKIKERIESKFTGKCKYCRKPFNIKSCLKRHEIAHETKNDFTPKEFVPLVKNHVVVETNEIEEINAIEETNEIEATNDAAVNEHINNMNADENNITTPIFVDVSLPSELNDALPSPSEPDDDWQSSSESDDDAPLSLKCLYCNVILNNRAQSEKHYADAHLYCLKCNEKFANSCYLRRHRNTIKHSGLYKCHYCNKGFKSKILRENHLCQPQVKLKIQKARTFTGNCKYCRKQFDIKSRLKRHEISHETKNDFTHKEYVPLVKNRVVGETNEIEETKDSAVVIKHINDFIANESNITELADVDVSLLYESNDADTPLTTKCLFCNVRLSDPTEMETHSLDSHLYCLKCNMAFTKRNDLRIHRRSVQHTGLYKCCHCYAKFKSKILRQEHLCENKAKLKAKREIIFTGKCKYCGKQLNTKTTLRIHERAHVIKREYVCVTCGLIFNNPATFKLHERYHISSKPYPCSVCSAKLSSHSSWTVHMRIHTGERPYKCEYCDKAFSTSGTKKQHVIEIHTKEYILKCDICGMGFTRHIRINTDMASYSSRGGTGIAGGGFIDGSSGRSETEFQRLSTTIATNIQKILQNVSTMTRLVNQFGTQHESPELTKQLHQTRTYIKQIIKDTDTLLRELGSHDNRHLKIQKDRLTDEFTAAITAFQAIQRKYIDIEKNSVREQRSHNVRISKPPGGGSSHGKNYKTTNNNNNSSSSSLFEDNFSDQKIDTHNSQQMQMQEDIDLHALEEQERTIRELEEDIVGVNEIYKKLGALVYEQGITVDSIESSVEQASSFVTSGTEQLRQASHYQNKLRKKKLIIALILATIVAFIIAIIVWQTK